MRTILLSMLLLSAFASSRGQTRLFVEPDFAAIGNSHEIIAIVPFKTSVTLRPKQMQALKEGQLEKMEKDESLSIQMSMYSWFLRRRQQGKMWVDVQDIHKTRIKLAENGIDYSNIHQFTPEELARILDVDAVINGTFETNKPMSEGASLVLGLLVGFYGTTNMATMNMFIYNGTDGKTLVNYTKAVAGSVGSSPDQLMNIIMRKASRRIPYTKPRK